VSARSDRDDDDDDDDHDEDDDDDDDDDGDDGNGGGRDVEGIGDVTQAFETIKKQQYVEREREQEGDGYIYRMGPRGWVE
jgi:hypothetical protein